MHRKKKMEILSFQKWLAETFEITNIKWFDKPFDRPFDRLTVLSNVDGLTVMSKVEGLTTLSRVEGQITIWCFAKVPAQ